jgi:hypothetical protein
MASGASARATPISALATMSIVIAGFFRRNMVCIHKELGLDKTNLA